MKNNKSIIKKFIGDEKKQTMMVPIIAVVMSLIAGMIVISMIGRNPLEAYQSLLQGVGI